MDLPDGGLYDDLSNDPFLWSVPRLARELGTTDAWGPVLSTALCKANIDGERLLTYPDLWPDEFRRWLGQLGNWEDQAAIQSKIQALQEKSACYTERCLAQEQWERIQEAYIGDRPSGTCTAILPGRSRLDNGQGPRGDDTRISPSPEKRPTSSSTTAVAQPRTPAAEASHRTALPSRRSAVGSGDASLSITPSRGEKSPADSSITVRLGETALRPRRCPQSRKRARSTGGEGGRRSKRNKMDPSTGALSGVRQSGNGEREESPADKASVTAAPRRRAESWPLGLWKKDKKCSKCDEEFISMPDYLRHHFQHNGYLCGTCKNRFDTAVCLAKHEPCNTSAQSALIRQDRKDKFLCIDQSCSQGFETKASRDSHYYSEHARIYCPVGGCLVTFYTPIDFEAHNCSAKNPDLIESLPAMKPFACIFSFAGCKTETTRKISWKDHVSCHLRIWAWECCGVDYLSKYRYKTHCKRKHADRTSVEPVVRRSPALPLYCRECKNFYQRDNDMSTALRDYMEHIVWHWLSGIKVTVASWLIKYCLKEGILQNENGEYQLMKERFGRMRKAVVNQ